MVLLLRITYVSIRVDNMVDKERKAYILLKMQADDAFNMAPLLRILMYVSRPHPNRQASPQPTSFIIWFLLTKIR